MNAPTIAELLAHPIVQQALEDAWRDSLPSDPTQRHEEGGWVYLDTITGDLFVRRAPAGTMARLNLNNPPLITDSMVVGTFHTHPNPQSEGWNPGPSPSDIRQAKVHGVPCLIRAEDGIHSTGPVSRRGGLTGSGGYPL